MNHHMGGAVAEWSVGSFLERVVWVQALPGDIVLCSWTRLSTVTVPISTQEYKWVPGISFFHATKTGISSGSYERVGSKASSPNESSHYLNCVATSM